MLPHKVSQKEKLAPTRQPEQATLSEVLLQSEGALVTENIFPDGNVSELTLVLVKWQPLHIQAILNSETV